MTNSLVLELGNLTAPLGAIYRRYEIFKSVFQAFREPEAMDIDVNIKHQPPDSISQS